MGYFYFKKSPLEFLKKKSFFLLRILRGFLSSFFLGLSLTRQLGPMYTIVFFSLNFITQLNLHASLLDNGVVKGVAAGIFLFLCEGLCEGVGLQFYLKIKMTSTHTHIITLPSGGGLFWKISHLAHSLSLSFKKSSGFRHSSFATSSLIIIWRIGIIHSQ